ncbi:MAG: electron transfer flavoprotein subunit alpha/FixB family protein [Magnetococcales bacterium]|nr:electron transfer flavoprotein subunit alpha/FixB family protein [Magnetococcales bacterium]
MTTLVLAEQRQGILASTVPHIVTAARQLGGSVTLLIGGSRGQQAAKTAARLTGVTTVLLLPDDTTTDPLPERLAQQIVQWMAVDHLDTVEQIVAAATPFGHALLPRLTALLDGSLVTNVMAINAPDSVTKPIHAGAVLVTRHLMRSPRLMTVTASSFTAAAEQEHRSATVITLPTLTMPTQATESWRLRPTSFQASHSNAQADLRSAAIVVAGGQGVASCGSFAIIEELARQLGGAVGATRSAVDAGVAASDWQIGQTGKIIAPKLYIAAGISGSLQHLAGIKDAGTIVAINHDPQAPIHAIADFSLVADLFQAIPALMTTLKQLATRPG